MQSLYEQLESYGASDFYPCHMPGHKRNAYGDMPADFASIDITEIAGFDNLHDAEGILKQAQNHCAKLCHAGESFFLINGSTGGVLSAISAATTFGGRILMIRNAHKSAYHAAYLRQLRITYLYPEVILPFDICEAITPEQVEQALSDPENRDLQAVFIVSPTYEGRIANVQQIAELVHKRGIPLIVDEAHGAHLGWSNLTTQNSCQAGADLVIQSVHKTLPAPTQTAILHVNGDLIDRNLLCRFLHIYQTSSPSYPLIAGIENSLLVMEKQGNSLFAAFGSAYSHLMDACAKCKWLEILPWSEENKNQQDIGKFVISGKKSGVSGMWIAETLRSVHHIEVEMVSATFVLAMFTVGDTEEGFLRMERAVLAMDSSVELMKRESQNRILHEEKRTIPSGLAERDFWQATIFSAENAPKVEIPLHLAWDGESELIPIREAQERISADFVNLYPPGAPILVPGERIDEKALYVMKHDCKLGLHVQGLVKWKERQQDKEQDKEKEKDKAQGKDQEKAQGKELEKRQLQTISAKEIDQAEWAEQYFICVLK